jgi:hypothetical protein
MVFQTSKPAQPDTFECAERETGCSRWIASKVKGICEIKEKRFGLLSGGGELARNCWHLVSSGSGTEDQG